MISFEVEGKPQADARPRVARGGGVYTSDKIRHWKADVRLAAAEAMQLQEPLTGPASVTIRIDLEPPKSWSGKKQEEAIGAWITTRPDADNYAKAILDAMNGVVFVDDCQVCHLTVMKVYSRLAGASVKVLDMTEKKS